ncbi:MAG: hypothetical protein H6881_07060 [Rhodobiaceae bacterium]|nr:hypothetical protein [Rhodobiaceae bacterium]MCC0061423.1 hypothetical protein [Rhodobiaceae bacterium]
MVIAISQKPRYQLSRLATRTGGARGGVQMGTGRILILTLLAFAISAVAGYFVVALAFFGAWELMGVHDQDGGGAMAVGFVFAPIGAAAIGVLGAAITAYRLMGKPALPVTQQVSRDKQTILRAALAAAGLFIGWKAANYAQLFLYGLSRENIVFGIMFASARYVLPILFAFIGYKLARRIGEKTQ